MIEIRLTDILFVKSANTGDPDCFCSRCGKVIAEGEMPLRMWTTDEKGEVHAKSKEYRFCEKCQEESGIKIAKTEEFKGWGE